MNESSPHQATYTLPVHIHWLGGWGVADSDMLTIAQQAFPQATHSAYAPTEISLTLLRNILQHGSPTTAACEQAQQAPCTAKANEQSTAHFQQSGQTHILAGYSTGAFLLLREIEHLASLPSPSNSRVLLFAPFADFRAESDLGGRVVTTRLKLLLRRLRSDPLAAVIDFYQQSGIALGSPTTLPYAQSDLIWGIEQLAQSSVSRPMLSKLRSNEFAHDISAWIGTDDALLDAEKIASLFTDGVCQIVQGASHDLTSLLPSSWMTPMLSRVLLVVIILLIC